MTTRTPLSIPDPPRMSSFLRAVVCLTMLLSVQISSVSSFAVVPTSFKQAGLTTTTTVTKTALLMSLKPAALPLMDSGKALARSGEFLIDLTTALDLYGGALSAAGANMRNAGDSVAQAAASARFKTGTELVCDELREAAVCMEEAATKLTQAAEEADVDGQPEFAKRIELAVEHIQSCSVALEAAGAGIMMRQPLVSIGGSIAAAGADLEKLSPLFAALDSGKMESKDAGQRLAFAAEKMIEAGNALKGVVAKPSGKSWLKGGTS